MKRWPRERYAPARPVELLSGVLIVLDCIKQKRTHEGSILFYGAKEIRTPDLLHAMQALYQLSYNPEGTPNIEKYCLVVKGWRKKI